MGQAGQENNFFSPSDKHENLQQLFCLIIRKIFKHTDKKRLLRFCTDLVDYLQLTQMFKLCYFRICNLVKRFIPQAPALNHFRTDYFEHILSKKIKRRSNSDIEAQMLTAWHIFWNTYQQYVLIIILMQRYHYFKDRITTSTCAHYRNLQK